MIAMLLITAMFMVSLAKRINLNSEAGDAIHPMAAPIVQEVRMSNAPVVTIERLRPQLSIFPSPESNQIDGLFPTLTLAGKFARANEYKMDSPESAESGRAITNTAVDAVIKDVKDTSSSPMEPSTAVDSAIAKAVDAVIKDVKDTASSPKEPSTAIDSAVTNTAVDAVIKDVKVAASLLKEPAIDTVESLKLDYFKGPWFQVYGSRSPTNLAFGNDALSSNYAPERGGSIRVVNRGVGFDGLPTKTTGKITAGGTASPGQRKVSFDKMEVGTGKAVMNQPGFEGDYQIYKLGPVVARQYEYAIVGDAVDPEGSRGETQLAVIARSPKSFKKYDGEVRDWLMKNGFTSVQEPPRMTGGKSR